MGKHVMPLPTARLLLVLPRGRLLEFHLGIPDYYFTLLDYDTVDDSNETMSGSGAGGNHKSPSPRTNGRPGGGGLRYAHDLVQ